MNTSKEGAMRSVFPRKIPLGPCFIMLPEPLFKASIRIGIWNTQMLLFSFFQDLISSFSCSMK